MSNNNESNSIYKTILKRRNLLELTRTTVSSLIGVKMETYASWEKGQLTSKFNQLVKWLKVLGLSIEQLDGEERFLLKVPVLQSITYKNSKIYCNFLNEGTINYFDYIVNNKNKETSYQDYIYMETSPNIHSKTLGTNKYLVVKINNEADLYSYIDDISKKRFPDKPNRKYDELSKNYILDNYYFYMIALDMKMQSLRTIKCRAEVGLETIDMESPIFCVDTKQDAFNMRYIKPIFLIVGLIQSFDDIDIKLMSTPTKVDTPVRLNYISKGKNLPNN